jgi:hypothetical protein
LTYYLNLIQTISSYAAYLIKLMSRKDTFPLSPTNAKRAIVLLIAYGLILIIAAGYYYIVSGDRSFPLPYLFQLTLIGVCAWGINSRRTWALLLAGVYAAWQIYNGVSNMIVFMDAGGWNGPTSGKVIIGLLSLRTIVLIVLILLLFFSSRERLDKR